MTDFTWTDSAFEPIARRVAERTGLLFREMQRDSVERGILLAMKSAGLAHLGEYFEHLQKHVSAFDNLVAELTVGETYFFRDVGQFGVIRQQVIPEVRSRRGFNHVFRAWSAACASGEEPYSLAMLFHAEGLGPNWHVLGTDVSRLALQRAKAATYGEWSLRGEGAEFARPHLHQVGKEYQVCQALRQRVAFEYLNLALDLYPSTVTGTRDLDLILCRNVLIYFDHDTIRAVAQRLYESLAPDGWLITASGDPILEDFAPWHAELTPAGLVYRRRSQPATKKGSGRLESIDVFDKVEVETESAHVLANVATSEWQIETTAITVEPVAECASPPVVSLADAEAAMRAGDYARAAELAARCEPSEAASAIHVQALANVNPSEAEAACAAALKRFGLSAQLYYLRAVLLLELDREQDAVAAAQRAVYLQPSLVIAHFLLGSIFRRLDDRSAACRAFRSVRDLCLSRPAEEPVQFSDGEHAGSLARAAEQQLRSLEQ
jgi:chemotaxis protein methyltransferase CheR